MKVIFDRVSLESERNGLKATVGEKLLTGKIWGVHGALMDSVRIFEIARELNEETASIIPLASAYFTAAGNALTKGISWYPVAVWCLLKANFLQRKFHRLAGGTENASAGELEISAEILRTVGKIFFWRRKNYLALATRFIKEGLARNVSEHDQALLHISFGKILDETSSESQARNEFKMALRLVKVNWANVDGLTAARVYRALAGHYSKYGYYNEALDYLNLASREAEVAGNLGDQLAKISAEIMDIAGKMKKH